MRKRLKKISIIGHFGFSSNLLNGQTIKTKIITDQLIKEYGNEQIIKYDTHGGMKALIKIPFQIFDALRRSENIIIFPGQRGLRVIIPLLFFLNLFFRKTLHYCVIGGWLPKLIKNKKILKKQLKKFTGLYVETTTMKKELENSGFSNIVLMPNCKDLMIISEEELVYQIEEPLKLCTFSRVMKEKGIEDAIYVVKKINEKYARTVYELDIYGQVDINQLHWFKQISEKFPEYIRYGGEVQFDKSVEVLKNYYALLFPTRFYTEGIPGTIIDAYAAGVPVISAKWESFSDVIEDNVTGIGYDFGNNESLIDILENVALNNDIILSKKINCIMKAKEFLPSKATKNFIFNK